jgi:MerR family transcriptional regulator, copper efflux regulator
VAEYRISQLAERTGFSASTLRYYEQAGLLPSAARTPGGYRRYDEHTVERLRFIARAKQLGLPLEEIRELTTVWDAGDCGPVQARLAAVLTTRITEVQARIAELTAFGEQLVAARDGLAHHTPAGPCDASCGCLGNGDARHRDNGAVPPRRLRLLDG